MRPEFADTWSRWSLSTESESSPPAAAACSARRAPTRSETVSVRVWPPSTGTGSPASRCASTMPSAPGVRAATAWPAEHCGPSCTSASAPARPPPHVLLTASGTPAFQAASSSPELAVAAPNETRSAGTAPGPRTPSVTPLKWPTLVAATVMASSAEPGDEIDPPPRSSPLLPAATTVTTPARAAPWMARATRSFADSTSGSPSERLSTSMPSATARSIARAISGPLPSRPNEGVGVVSTRYEPR